MSTFVKLKTKGEKIYSVVYVKMSGTILYVVDKELDAYMTEYFLILVKNVSLVRAYQIGEDYKKANPF